MTVQTLLKHDRWFVRAGIVGVTVLAWGYLFYLAQAMAPMSMPADMSADMSAGMSPGMSMAAMPMAQAWQPREAIFMFLMWAVMMVAMMMPAAAPMLLTYAALDRQQPVRSVLSPTSAFAGGYLAVWVGFALVATIVQGLLHQAALLSPMLATTNTWLGSALLIVAGVYQWTPLKSACLQRCRTPVSFLLNEWRAGTAGAFQMGVKHGYFCLGCCWSLMALLFVAGVMNLVWIAILTVLVLAEKVVPQGQLLSRLAGVVFIVWGIWLAATGLV